MVGGGDIGKIADNILADRQAATDTKVECKKDDVHVSRIPVGKFVVMAAAVISDA